jgi:uncharacterized protein
MVEEFDQLIILTRLPCAGRSKTRLIPALGAAGAAEFHDRLARHTMQRARDFCNAAAGVQLVVRLDGGSEEEGRAWLGECDVRPQGAGDLGARIERAFQVAFHEGAQRVVVVGTDCPELIAADYAAAFSALATTPLVYGPACDGGYYLVGLAEMHSPLFRSIPWSGSTVLKESLAVAEGLGLGVELLRTLPDVDLPEDLPAAKIALGISER